MATGAAAATSRAHVLVVDDESLLRWALSEALSALGYRVKTANDGRAALRLLVEDAPAPDVVLLDYRLPYADGLALLPEIRALAPESRIVLMTAYWSPEVAARAFALGACRVVDKPIDMEQVAELVA